MAVTIDESGRYLVDDDGTPVAMIHSDACVARVSELAFGVVLQSGVGSGDIRNALLSNCPMVSEVQTEEANGDLLAYADAAFPADSGASSMSRSGQTTGASVSDSDVTPPLFGPTMGIFDISLSDADEDLSFLENLKALWPDAGGRVVALSERADVTLDGFHALGPELIDWTYIYVFDRFDPTNGVGEAHPHGRVLNPGYGWQE